MGRCFCWLKQSLELVVPCILAIKAGWPTERCCRLVGVLLIKIRCLCCEESLSLVLLHTCLCMCLVISHTDSFSYKWAASSVPYYPPSVPQAITPAVTGETLGVSEWAACPGLCEQAATWAHGFWPWRKVDLVPWRWQEAWCSSRAGWPQTVPPPMSVHAKGQAVLGFGWYML